MKKALAIFFLVALSAGFVFGVDAGHHGDSHIPVKTILVQTINLGLLLILMFFAVRKTIVAAFKSKQLQYTEQAAKTAAAMKQAEQSLSEIKEKLNTLESTEKQSLDNAKKEALNIKNKIIEDSAIQAKKIKEDVTLILSAELNKAKNEIRNEIISVSMDVAKKNISKSAEQITKKSENGFLQDLSKASGQVSL